MTAISEFLAMGGYAGFVWPSFLGTLALLLLLWLTSARSLKNSEAVLTGLDTKRPRR
jgi:heme exporter protein D